jgi:hypothetical protein
MKFITNDLQGFVNWFISEKTNNFKANERVLIFQQKGLYSLGENQPRHSMGNRKNSL